jgi:hypothetical protein
MRIRIFGALALALLAAGCEGNGTPIGGGWYAGERVSMSIDYRGATGTLYRKIGRKRIEVGTGVYEYKFYPPDCVLWQTGSALFGACGDRRPFPVAISLSLDWQLLYDRANYLGFFDVTGRKRPARPKFILIDSVRAVATRQPALDTSYQPSRRSDDEIDPSLEPTLGRPVIAGLEETDVQGRTILHRTVHEGSRERIQLLLAAGANPNARSGAG